MDQYSHCEGWKRIEAGSKNLFLEIKSTVELTCWMSSGLWCSFVIVNFFNPSWVHESLPSKLFLQILPLDFSIFSIQLSFLVIFTFGFIFSLVFSSLWTWLLKQILNHRTGSIPNLNKFLRQTPGPNWYSLSNQTLDACVSLIFQYFCQWTGKRTIWLVLAFEIFSNFRWEGQCFHFLGDSSSAYSILWLNWKPVLEMSVCFNYQFAIFFCSFWVEFTATNPVTLLKKWYSGLKWLKNEVSGSIRVYVSFVLLAIIFFMLYKPTSWNIPHTLIFWKCIYYINPSMRKARVTCSLSTSSWLKLGSNKYRYSKILTGYH